jgi:hypothetical protein
LNDFIKIELSKLVNRVKTCSGKETKKWEEKRNKMRIGKETRKSGIKESWTCCSNFFAKHAFREEAVTCP